MGGVGAVEDDEPALGKAGRLRVPQAMAADAAEQPMVAVADAATVTPQATRYGRIVATLLHVQGDQTPILDRQTLTDGSDAADRFPRAGVLLPSWRTPRVPSPRW